MRALTIPLILAGALASVAPRAAAQDLPPLSTIITSGEAVVRRAPDVAFLTVAVETRAKAPRDAQSQNADLMTAIVKRLADNGIAKEALRTSGLRVEQEFDFANGRRTPRGFVARNGVEVRIEDVPKAGEMADAVVQAGATSIDGIRFDLKDRAGAERDALRLAVADARARADAAAVGAGRSVGFVLNIEESRESGGVAPKTFMVARAAESASTPVEPGFIEVRARVTLTVSMR
jgi:uncharacterized protein YggE